MESVESKITLDLRDMRSSVVVNAKVRDTGRSILAAFTDGGKPYHLEEDCSACILAKSPDGRVIHDACKIEGQNVRYDVSNLVVAQYGTTECEFQITCPDGRMITSPSFSVVVHKSVYNEDTKSGVILSVARGATKTTRILLKSADGSTIAPVEGDVVRFGVKRTASDDDYLILKELTAANYEDGKYVLILDPADTENMDVGVYVFGIGIQNGTSYIPALRSGWFEVLPNATSREVSV